VNSTLLILAAVFLPIVLAVLYFLSRHVRQEEKLQVTTEDELEETLTA